VRSRYPGFRKLLYVTFFASLSKTMLWAKSSDARTLAAAFDWLEVVPPPPAPEAKKS
jgi:hypothetical protein